MKVTKIQYLAYDSNKMYIGTFEDKEFAQNWADKHGGYIDRHKIEKEESRIYDKALRKDERQKTARKILRKIDNLVEEKTTAICLAFSIKQWIAKQYGVEVEE